MEYLNTFFLLRIETPIQEENRLIKESRAARDSSSSPVQMGLRASRFTISMVILEIRFPSD
jgi:hypothetical protein